MTFAILAGAEDPLNELGDDQRQALQFAVEMLDAIWEAADELELDDHDLGRLAGRITGEVTLAVTTAGVGTVASKSATGIAVINKLNSLPFIPLAVKTRLIQKLPKFQAAATAIEGERAFFIASKIRELNPNLSHWEVFVEMLQRTNAAAARKALDPDMDIIVQSLMRTMYHDAISPGGAVDLTKIKKWHEIQQFRFNHPLGQRLWRLNLQNHHTVPKEWAKVLYRNVHGPDAEPPGGWDAWLNDMPGILLDRMDHVGGKGTGSFHEILGQKMVGIDLTDPNNTAEVLQRIGEAYGDWNTQTGPKVWAVAKKWLQDKGLAP